jgi:hypothetical protein
VPDVDALTTDVGQLWDAHQASRYGFAIARLPHVLAVGQAATQTYEGSAQERSFALLALTYPSAILLTKLGEVDFGWIPAERGFTAAAQRQRGRHRLAVPSVTHTLLSTGRYREAKQLTADAVALLTPGLADASPDYLSVYGTLFLAGAVAAARDEDRARVRSFLAEADEAARR